MAASWSDGTVQPAPVALEALVKRASMPVDLQVDVPEGLDPGIEAAVYFMVSEAITNARISARLPTHVLGSLNGFSGGKS